VQLKHPGLSHFKIILDIFRNPNADFMTHTYPWWC